jgi:hypothetical protein
MSSTQNAVEYQISVNWSDPASDSGSGFGPVGIIQTDLFGDAQAFALLAAWTAALPDTWNVTTSISKQEATEVNYVTDLTSTPPSFT